MSTATTTRRTSAGRRPAVLPDREADLLAAAEILAARGELVSCRALAREARITASHADTVRRRLLRAGRWPWPVASSGWLGGRMSAAARAAQILAVAHGPGGPPDDRAIAARLNMGLKTVAKARLRLRRAGRWPAPAYRPGTCPGRRDAILAAAEALGAAASDRRIAERAGCSRSVVQLIRHELTAAGLWPFAADDDEEDDDPGYAPCPRTAAELAALAVLQAELPHRIAAIQAETFAGQVHPPKDDEMRPWAYRRPARPEPIREDPAERERRLRRLEVAEWVREWKRARRERRGACR